MVNLKVHDGLVELCELLSLQWLGEAVHNHVIGQTMIDMQFFLVDVVSDEKMANVDVFSPLAAAQFSILLEQNGSLVVLE